MVFVKMQSINIFCTNSSEGDHEGVMITVVAADSLHLWDIVHRTQTVSPVEMINETPLDLGGIVHKLDEAIMLEPTWKSIGGIGGEAEIKIPRYQCGFVHTD